MGAVDGLRVAVCGIVDGPEKNGFVDTRLAGGRRDERAGSFNALDSVDDCRGPRTFVLFRFTFGLRLRRMDRRSFSRWIN